MKAEPLHLTNRDQEILHAVALQVRLLNLRQLAETWWNGDLPNARRRLKRLVHAGLLTSVIVPARALPPLEAPLVRWNLGDPKPEFGSVAYRCQDRWRGRAVHPSTVWIATEQAAQLYGGVRRGELKHPAQATHDLGVAAVWLRLKQIAPEWAGAWRGEDQLAHTRVGEKLPDAFIVDAEGTIRCVIEFGGAYDAERVQAFHADCVARNLPYQLW